MIKYLIPLSLILICVHQNAGGLVISKRNLNPDCSEEIIQDCKDRGLEVINDEKNSCVCVIPKADEKR
ncbi:Hypothetical predicted protein [Mytilus galloprovincialis]|nr:Hypothetical predicted protein [Mytilus galloprovincialis]